MMLERRDFQLAGRVEVGTLIRQAGHQRAVLEYHHARRAHERKVEEIRRPDSFVGFPA